MEIALRRLGGFAEISISSRKQTLELVYKPGSRFNPTGIRDAVARADVEVLKFQIEARGCAQQKGADRLLIAGEEKFLLVNSPGVPLGSPLKIWGTVDDEKDVPELQVTEHNLLKPEDFPDGKIPSCP